MVAEGQLVWLFSKGDLVLSNEPKVAQKIIPIIFNETEKREGKLNIYSYDYDDRPRRIQTATDSIYQGSWRLSVIDWLLAELTVAKILEYDLSDIPLSEFGRMRSPKRRSYYYTANLALVMTLDDENLEATIKFNGRVITGPTNVMY